MFKIGNTYRVSFKHINFNSPQFVDCPENLGAVTYCMLIRLRPKRKILATGYSWTPNLDKDKNRKRAMANTLQQIFPGYPGKLIRKEFWSAYFNTKEMVMRSPLSYKFVAGLFDIIFRDALESECQRANARETWLLVLKFVGWTEEEWETALEERLDHNIRRLECQLE